MTETEHARLDAELFAACEAYFKARPQFDSSGARRIFEAGFVRAWKVERVPIMFLTDHTTT